MRTLTFLIQFGPDICPPSAFSLSIINSPHHGLPGSPRIQESIIVDSRAKTNSYSVNIEQFSFRFSPLFPRGGKNLFNKHLFRLYLLISTYGGALNVNTISVSRIGSRIRCLPAWPEMGTYRSLPRHPVRVCHSSMIDNSDDSCV